MYHSPKTKEEIAEELGVTLVYIQDRIEFLEGNGFLQKTTGGRFTTYVRFTPETFSLEMRENKQKKQLEIAQTLVKEYVPAVREAISGVTEVYIPGGNRELLEASAIFYGVANKCRIPICKDLSSYVIKTTDGGEYITFVELEAEQSDVEYKATLPSVPYWACGDMMRISEKYPAVASWSIDTRLCSRQGGWQNNLTADYEYVYEFLNGFLCDNAANAEKLQRLRERAFLTPDNQINIMMVKERDFFEKIPPLDDTVKERFAHTALEYAMLEAKNYPPQMQDLVIDWGVGGFIGAVVALMVMDILYGDGTLRPLTENEKVTSNLIMFSDRIP